MALEDSCFFDGHKVTGLFDNAHQLFTSPAVTAYHARVMFGEGKARGAEVDGAVQIGQCGRELLGLTSWTAQDMKRQSGGRFLADAGKCGKALYQSFQCRWNYLHDDSTSEK
jgi:hypothetical protein